jgi:hypothetical protein
MQLHLPTRPFRNFRGRERERRKLT